MTPEIFADFDRSITLGRFLNTLTVQRFSPALQTQWKTVVSPEGRADAEISDEELRQAFEEVMGLQNLRDSSVVPLVVNQRRFAQQVLEQAGVPELIVNRTPAAQANINPQTPRLLATAA